MPDREQERKTRVAHIEKIEVDTRKSAQRLTSEAVSIRKWKRTANGPAGRRRAIVTKASTGRCLSSAKCCRPTAHRWSAISRSVACRARKSWPRSLLEGTLIRVGNEEYAKTNNSFGLTTLLNRHVKVEGDSRIRFDFRGKSGTEHHIDLSDRKLARIVRGCQELRGQELFQYLDDEAQLHALGLDDVNEYLRDITGGKSPPKTSAPGPQRNSPHWPCSAWRCSTPQAKAKKTFCRRSKRSQRCWATRRRSVASATSIRRFSTAILMARCSRPSGSVPTRSLPIQVTVCAPRKPRCGRLPGAST
jgi:hypothetical protein